MTITIMLGNGFDVSLGIKSSYTDFYKWYCSLDSKIQHIEEFRKSIKEYLSKEDIPDKENTWADFEIGLGQYTTYFTKDTVGDFLGCYEDAQQKIREYLIEQEKTFDLGNYSEKAITNWAESLVQFHRDVSDLENVEINEVLNSRMGENRDISFITFNYTKTLEKIIKRLPDRALNSWKYSGVYYSCLLNRNIIHVHGTTNEFPILGVNDESQIANKELLDTPQFRDLTIKEKSVQAVGKLWQNQAEKQILNSDMICILGMSIGPSDAKWWQKIVQWLKEREYRHIILYWFEKDPPDGVSIVKQLRSVELAKEKLLSYSKVTDSEKVALKKRIHVVINTSHFLHLEKTEQKKPIDGNADTKTEKSLAFV